MPGTATSVATVKSIWIMTTVMGRWEPCSTSLLMIIIPALAAMKQHTAVTSSKWRTTEAGSMRSAIEPLSVRSMSICDEGIFILARPTSAVG